MSIPTPTPIHLSAVRVPKNLVWRDLCRLRPLDTALEISRPVLLWLLAVLAIDWGGLAVGAVLAFAHLAALRAAHEAVHHNLGISRRGDTWVMALISALLATSVHALAHTHRRHHARCMDPEDLEGKIAHASFWRALIMSPAYHGLVIREAWLGGNAATRRGIAIDLTLALAIHGLLWSVIGPPMATFWGGLALFNGASGLLGVWLFHRASEHVGVRSGRSRLCNLLTLNMLYHAEHHRFPAVPTARLGRLAQRLTEAGVPRPAPLIDHHWFWRGPANPSNRSRRDRSDPQARPSACRRG